MINKIYKYIFYVVFAFIGLTLQAMDDSALAPYITSIPMPQNSLWEKLIAQAHSHRSFRMLFARALHDSQNIDPLELCPELTQGLEDGVPVLLYSIIEHESWHGLLEGLVDIDLLEYLHASNPLFWQLALILRSTLREHGNEV